MADTTISGLPYVLNTNALSSCVIPVSDGLVTNKANLSSFALISSGTFTPYFAVQTGSIGAISYAYQSGKFYRVGDLVHVFVQLATSAYTIPSNWQSIDAQNTLYVEMPGAPAAWGSGSGLAAMSQTMQCNNWNGYDSFAIYHPHSAGIMHGSSRLILGRGTNQGQTPVFPGDGYQNSWIWWTDLTNHTSATRNEFRTSITYMAN